MQRLPWIPTAPRFALLDGPSPLRALERFSDALRAEVGRDGPEVWIKREDLLPLAFGGNKLRNLEFHVGAALSAGADTLVTSGRRWSNHCRLTAAAGARAGLAVELVLSGSPRSVPGPNERLDELLGATVHLVPGDVPGDREAAVGALMTRLAAEARRPYQIPVGGSGSLGVIGQVLAGLELAAQLAEAGTSADSIVVPTATGGTQAGILVGLRLAGLPTRVRAMAVSKPAAELAPTVTRLAREVAALADPDGERGPFAARDWAAEVDIDDRTLGAGYGRRSAPAEAAGRLLARTEGIIVDPIYTGKALAGLVAAVRDGRLGGERRIVFWHAGGTPGFFEHLTGDDPPLAP